jgi:hypothetical protein
MDATMTRSMRKTMRHLLALSSVPLHPLHPLRPLRLLLPLLPLVAACAADPPQAPPPAEAPHVLLARPQVPQALEAPAGEKVTSRAVASGVQIYECQAEGWKLVGPNAELRDDRGQSLGKHYVGPTWEAADGSKVVGEVQQKADAPDGKGVSWLLLKAKSTEGSGAFAKVTSIQRVGTEGGKAPSGGCDANAVGTRQSVPYSATYYFYSGAPKS